MQNFLKMYNKLVIFYLLMVIINKAFGCVLFHNVVDGDTCFKIALKYSMQLNEFLKLNPNLICENIGQTKIVCIRHSNFERPLISSCTQSYTVVSGDRCEDLAKQFGISMDNLLNLNPNIDCIFIGKYVGQKLCLNSTCLKYYLMDEGDTCDLIAYKNSITIEKLYTWNPNVDCINMDFTRLCVKKD